MLIDRHSMATTRNALTMHRDELKQQAVAIHAGIAVKTWNGPLLTAACAVSHVAQESEMNKEKKS